MSKMLTVNYGMLWSLYICVMASVSIYAIDYNGCNFSANLLFFLLFIYYSLLFFVTLLFYIFVYYTSRSYTLFALVVAVREGICTWGPPTPHFLVFEVVSGVGPLPGISGAPFQT